MQPASWKLALTDLIGLWGVPGARLCWIRTADGARGSLQRDGPASALSPVTGNPSVLRPLWDPSSHEASSWKVSVSLGSPSLPVQWMPLGDAGGCFPWSVCPAVSLSTPRGPLLQVAGGCGPCPWSWSGSVAFGHSLPRMAMSCCLSAWLIPLGYALCLISPRSIPSPTGVSDAPVSFPESVH